MSGRLFWARFSHGGSLLSEVGTFVSNIETHSSDYAAKLSKILLSFSMDVRYAAGVTQESEALVALRHDKQRELG